MSDLPPILTDEFWKIVGFPPVVTDEDGKEIGRITFYDNGMVRCPLTDEVTVFMTWNELEISLIQFVLYVRWLHQKHPEKKTWTRTDYLTPMPEEFFEDVIAGKVLLSSD